MKLKIDESSDPLNLSMTPKFSNGVISRLAETLNIQVVEFNMFFASDLNFVGDAQFGWLVLLLYAPSQQLWSLRDGQFT